MPLHYSIGLLLLFYALLVAEFFVPSGGLIGIAAVISALSSVVVAFTHNFQTGVIVLGVLLITTPFLFTAMVRVWPRTPLGRRMLNRRPGQPDDAMPDKTTPRGVPLKELVGRQGVADSDLIPAGSIRIGDERLDAVSAGGPIDQGISVVVTDVTAGRIRVRVATKPVSDAETDRSTSDLDRTFDIDDFT